MTDLPPLLSDAILLDSVLREAVKACCKEPDSSGMYLVSEDDEACRMAAAWPRATRWWVTPKGVMPLIASELIVPWVWSGIRFDVKALGRAAGVLEGRVELVWDIVKGSGVVWPDGRLSEGGQSIFDAMIKPPGASPEKGPEPGEEWKQGG